VQIKAEAIGIIQDLLKVAGAMSSLTHRFFLFSNNTQTQVFTSEPKNIVEEFFASETSKARAEKLKTPPHHRDPPPAPPCREGFLLPFRGGWEGSWRRKGGGQTKGTTPC
jgi:hypothetical protein